MSPVPRPVLAVPLLAALVVGCAGQQEAAPAAAASAAPAAGQKSRMPDWNAAVDIEARRTDAGAEIVVHLKPGFHVYGARETTSRPLRVSVDGHPDARAAVPDGEPKAVAGVEQPAWVLTGDIVVPVEVPGAEGALGGSVSYQVCTDRLCSMPTRRAWKAVPAAGDAAPAAGGAAPAAGGAAPGEAG